MHSDRALALIREQTGSARVLVYGHSAGGLIVSLWLDRLRRRRSSGATARAGVAGLVLNSPFLDLPGPGVLRCFDCSQSGGHLPVAW